MSIEVTTEEVTPEMAQEYLGRNSNNRNLRNRRTEQYARDMKTGKWRLNGDAIRFNGNGKLIDGQHRLMACITANKSFRTVVIRGLSDADHATIDTGLTRSLGDELKWRGETDYNNLGAVLNLIWNIDNGWSWNASRADLLRILASNPSVRDSLKTIKVAKRIGFRGTALAAAHHLASLKHGARADEWIAAIDAGTDYVEGDPCLALRNYAIGVTSNRGHRPTSQEWLAVAIKSFNYWVTGTPIPNLRWRRVGPKREQFPTIVSAEDAT